MIIVRPCLDIDSLGINAKRWIVKALAEVPLKGIPSFCRIGRFGYGKQNEGIVYIGWIWNGSDFARKPAPASEIKQHARVGDVLILKALTTRQRIVPELGAELSSANQRAR